MIKFTMRFCILIPILFFSVITNAQGGENYYQRALEFKEQKDYENAIVYVNKALSFDSTNVDYYDLKAECYYRLRKPDEALSTYTEGLQKNPFASFLLFKRGYLFLLTDKFNQAKNDFTKFLESAKDDSLINFAYIYRAGAKTGIRDFQGSYEDLMISYNLDSNNIVTLNELGRICDDIGKMDDAIRYLLKAIDLKPDFIPAIINLGYKYQQLEQHEKAILYFNKVLELEPNNPFAFSNRSYSRYKLGDLKNAMDDINHSINVYPRNSYAYRVRALIYIEMTDINNACIDLNTAIEKGYTGVYGDEAQNLKKKYCKAN